MFRNVKKHVLLVVTVVVFGERHSLHARFAKGPRRGMMVCLAERGEEEKDEEEEEEEEEKENEEGREASPGGGG